MRYFTPPATRVPEANLNRCVTSASRVGTANLSEERKIDNLKWAINFMKQYETRKERIERKRDGK